MVKVGVKKLTGIFRADGVCPGCGMVVEGRISEIVRAFETCHVHSKRCRQTRVGHDSNDVFVACEKCNRWQITKCGYWKAPWEFVRLCDAETDLGLTPPGPDDALVVETGGRPTGKTARLAAAREAMEAGKAGVEPEGVAKVATEIRQCGGPGCRRKAPAHKLRFHEGLGMDLCNEHYNEAERGEEGV